MYSNKYSNQRRYHSDSMTFSKCFKCFQQLALALVFASNGSLCSYAWADDDTVDAAKTERQLKQVKKSIESIQHLIKKTQSRHSATEESLRKSEVEIGSTRADLRQAGLDIAQSNDNLAKLKRQQSNLEIAKQNQKLALADDVQAAYRTGRQEYVKLLLNQQQPEKLARVLKYYDYFHQARLKNINIFNQTLADIESNRQAIDQEIDQLESLRKSLVHKQEQLQAAQKRRKSVLAELKATLQTKDSQLKKLKSNEDELQKLLKAVQETLADLPQDIGNTPFSKSKGKLRWPTKGHVANRFGAQREDGKLRWNGILIKNQPGTPVKAIARGRVVFSDWMRGFGLLTIVDHGDNYLTLYGHNESLLKAPGAWVNANDIIAYTGNSGGQASAGLYFEIRYKGDPVNPAQWCKG